eukprot:114314_1
MTTQEDNSSTHQNNAMFYVFCLNIKYNSHVFYIPQHNTGKYNHSMSRFTTNYSISVALHHTHPPNTGIMSPNTAKQFLVLIDPICQTQTKYSSTLDNDPFEHC